MIYENDNDDEDDDDLEENEDLTLNREENKHQKTINMMQKTKKSNQNNVDLDFFSQFTSNISSGKQLQHSNNTGQSKNEKKESNEGWDQELELEFDLLPNESNH